jgi:DNA-binding NarL/FixJ family response regulator
MATPVKIAIADDHKLLRHGIISLLQEMKDIEIIGEMSTGEEAVNFATLHKPDVFLIDIVMTGMTGIEATRWIKEQAPQIKIILISSEVSKEYITAGVKSGIDGYLNKNISREILHEAILTVLKGERYFTPEIMQIVFQDFFAKQTGGVVPAEKAGRVLTKREAEVLSLIASGKTIKQVADELFISAKTVETHKIHIQDKLGLTNTAQLVKYAIDHKMI